MAKLFHYTSLKSYTISRQAGALLATTQIIYPKVNTFFLLGQDMDKRYLFCLKDTPEPKDWIESGWLEFIRRRQGKDGYALLSFETDDAIVLNGSYMYDAVDNIKASVKDKDVNNLTKLSRVIKHGPKVRKGFKQYLNSKIPLQEYDGSYRLAEFLVTKDIPFSKVTLEDLVKKN